jgi:tetratricopeptide (TPR) repeat protein
VQLVQGLTTNNSEFEAAARALQADKVEEVNDEEKPPVIKELTKQEKASAAKKEATKSAKKGGKKEAPVPISDEETKLNSFNLWRDKGDDLAKEDKWTEAIEAYNTALTFTEDKDKKTDIGFEIDDCKSELAKLETVQDAVVVEENSPAAGDTLPVDAETKDQPAEKTEEEKKSEYYDENVKTGDDLAIQKKWSEALAYYLAAEEFAQAKDEKENIEAAIANMRSMVVYLQSSNEADVRYQEGNWSEAVGLYERAIEHIVPMLDDNETTQDMIALVGICKVNIANAEKDAKFEALYKKATELQAEKNYVEAMGCYNEALDFCNDSTRQAEIRTGNIEKCVELEVGTKMWIDTKVLKAYKTNYIAELFPAQGGDGNGE